MPAPPRDPILDISLMRIPTFGTSVIAGAITRLTPGRASLSAAADDAAWASALPPLQSGLMTLATALGSIAAKPVAPIVAAPLRLPRHPDGQRLFRQRGLCAVRAVPSRLADAADVRDHDRERIFHVDPVHRLQHHRL